MSWNSPHSKLRTTVRCGPVGFGRVRCIRTSDGLSCGIPSASLFRFRRFVGPGCRPHPLLSLSCPVAPPTFDEATRVLRPVMQLPVGADEVHDPQGFHKRTRLPAPSRGLRDITLLQVTEIAVLGVIQRPSPKTTQVAHETVYVAIRDHLGRCDRLLVPEDVAVKLNPDHVWSPRLSAERLRPQALDPQWFRSARASEPG